MLIIFFIPSSLLKKIKKTSPPYFPNSFPLEEKKKEEERKGKGRKRSWGLSRGFRNFLKQLGCFLRRLSAASLSASSHFPRERVRRVALFLLSRGGGARIYGKELTARKGVCSRSENRGEKRAISFLVTSRNWKEGRYCSGSTDASKIVNTVSLVCFCSSSSFVSSQLREISVSSSVPCFAQQQ